MWRPRAKSFSLCENLTLKYNSPFSQWCLGWMFVCYVWLWGQGCNFTNSLMCHLYGQITQVELCCSLLLKVCGIVCVYMPHSCTIKARFHYMCCKASILAAWLNLCKYYLAVPSGPNEPIKTVWWRRMKNLRCQYIAAIFPFWTPPFRR